MKIVCIGGGPAGLYFALLMKKEDARHDVRVFERNRADDTFGFGVVFSDATLANLDEADAPSYAAIRKSFWHWDDIDTHIGGQVIRSRGHGFAGMSRQRLLTILQDRCREVGVDLAFEREIADPSEVPDADLVVVADGVNSPIRTRHADSFQPNVDLRPNRFTWLGTTFPFEAFTFYFRENEHGLFRVHAYRYQEDRSTFIVECTDETFRKSGLDPADEDATAAYCERLFAKELAGHRLLKNRSIWRQFPTVKVGHFHHGNMVLMGDAVHTAHFSIGSGTKLALEDAIALRDALRSHGATREALPGALGAYEGARRPVVDSLQRAAQVSLEWFENTERYMKLPPLRFTASMLTRSLRVTHENLRVRDPGLVGQLDAMVAAEAQEQSGVTVPRDPPPPPMFTPYRLRDLVLANRVVVSPMCQYSAPHEDGVPGDWHLVHLGSRALGGAGLVITEMADVSPEGRITLGCVGLWNDEQMRAWKRIVDFVHGQSPAKIGVQLAHAGRKAATQRPWENKGAPLPPAQAWPLVAPSALAYSPASQVPRAMTRADMDKVRDDFTSAALRADRAGFDLLEIHMAHGYLLSTFISPVTNVRTDEYGGSLANRMRFPLEVLRAVRGVWPAKPLSVRISATDWVQGGMTGAEAVEVARQLKDNGCDVVDVSAGGVTREQKPVYGRLFQTPFAERIRLDVGVPTMTVGAISSFADINSIIVAGRADLCVLARAHLYDPYFTRHAAAALRHSMPWPDPYESLTRFQPR